VLSCQRGDAPGGEPTIAADSAQVLFTSVCSSCHGAAGEGTRLGPNLKSGKWLQTDGTPRSIERVIERGIAKPRNFASPMPASGGANLTKEQIRGLAQYVSRLNTPPRSE
jgi:mono/diheme cytochrome c family protein